jgi:ABC-type transport system involved in multi-copper enzyme maturation permease subunit
MLRYVVHKEINDCIYGYRSLLIFVLSAVLFFMAVYTGVRSHHTNLEEYNLAQSALHHQLAERTVLWTLSTAGLDIAKAPPVLEILVSGIEPYTPQIYFFNLYLLPQPQGSSTSENPMAAVFGSLDLLFVVQVVLGLAALLFTFSSITGEKETGTLKLQLANALPKDTLLLGKLIGNLVAFLVPVALAFALSALMLAAFPGISLSGEQVLRIALIGVDFLLFLVVIFSLGICISTMTARSTLAFGISLVCWVTMVAIIPKFAVVLARQLAPEESLESYEMQKVEVDREGTNLFEAKMNDYRARHPTQQIPHEVYDDLLKQAREKQNQDFARLEDEYTRAKENQARMALLLSRLSPAGSASFAAMDLAETNLQRDIRFRAALEDYRMQFTAYYDQKANQVDEALKRDPHDTSADVMSFEDLPPFHFQDELLPVSINRALPDLGLLILWALAFFAISYFRFLRYDVR